MSYKTRHRTINTFDKKIEFTKISLLFKGKIISKLKLGLFLIFLAVWKFQIRDRGRGGYCGSSWISLSSVHNFSHRLHFQKKIATQYIVHLERSACHQCTFVHIACHNRSVRAKYCQVVHSEPQKSLSIQSLSIQSLSKLQHFNKIQEGTPQWIILL